MSMGTFSDFLKARLLIVRKKFENRLAVDQPYTSSSKAHSLKAGKRRRARQQSRASKRANR